MSVHDYSNGGIPKTMEELQDYCERNDFTPSKTRFFINYDYKGAKAFGIYKDEATGEFVVYKNKADGSRAVRYRGNDEEFAVVELYDRLQSEIENQKLHYAAEMAERERKKYESHQNYDEGLEHIKNFSIDKYPLKSESGRVDYSDDYDQEYSGSEGGSGEKNPLSIIIGIIAIIISLLFCFGGVGGGGSSYRSYNSYDHSYHSSYDSGWSSSDWDSGYTDWNSNW